MTAREPFYPAELFPDETETPEIVAAIFAADGFRAEGQHGAGQPTGAIINTAPKAQIHPVAGGAISENHSAEAVLKNFNN